MTVPRSAVYCLQRWIGAGSCPRLQTARAFRVCVPSPPGPARVLQKQLEMNRTLGAFWGVSRFETGLGFKFDF